MSLRQLAVNLVTIYKCLVTCYEYADHVAIWFLSFFKTTVFIATYCHLGSLILKTVIVGQFYQILQLIDFNHKQIRVITKLPNSEQSYRFIFPCLWYRKHVYCFGGPRVVQSVHFTTKVVNSIPTHREVYLIQHDVIKFQWLATGRWFSASTPLFSTNKTDRHDITEIL